MAIKYKKIYTQRGILFIGCSTSYLSNSKQLSPVSSCLHSPGCALCEERWSATSVSENGF